MPHTYDTRIASAAAAQSSRKIRQEFARVLDVPAQAGGRKRHGLTFREVVYFRLKESLEAEGMALVPSDRRAIYRVMTGKNRTEGGWVRNGRTLKRTGKVTATFELTNIVGDARGVLRDALRGKTVVERNPDICAGAPVFKGTRIPVAQVVEQFRSGVPRSEIAEDYPQISDSALRYAEVQSRIASPPGRPSKALELRRITLEAID